MGDEKMAVTDVRRDAFQTQSELRPEAIVVRMRGNADIDAQASLKAFLDTLHGEAKRLGVRELVFELQELYFMNSSCLSLLLRHVNAVREEADRKYRLVYRSNQNLRWQRKSLMALQAYAPEVVGIE